MKMATQSAKIFMEESFCLNDLGVGRSDMLSQLIILLHQLTYLAYIYNNTWRQLNASNSSVNVFVCCFLYTATLFSTIICVDLYSRDKTYLGQRRTSYLDLWLHMTVVTQTFNKCNFKKLYGCSFST